MVPAMAPPGGPDPSQATARSGSAGPPSYTGRHTGLPGSRRSVISLRIGEKFGEPASIGAVHLREQDRPGRRRPPRFRTRRGSRRRRAASAASARAPPAIAPVRPSTSARFALPACSLSTTNESQLGSWEYCIATMAVSPPCMNSSGSASVELTQPMPVVPAMASTSRWKAPVRSSSATANSGARFVDFGLPARARPVVLGAVPAHVHPYRVLRGAPGHLGDPAGGERGAGEVAALVAEFAPLDQRVRGCRRHSGSRTGRCRPWCPDRCSPRSERRRRSRRGRGRHRGCRRPVPLR